MGVVGASMRRRPVMGRVAVPLLCVHCTSAFTAGGRSGSRLGRQELTAKTDPTEDDGGNDSFLERKVFDPDADDANPFSQLVKSDYEMAEFLYSGVVIIGGTILAQEALRMVKYGDAYVPFTAGGGGSLF